MALATQAFASPHSHEQAGASREAGRYGGGQGVSGSVDVAGWNPAAGQGEGFGSVGEDVDRAIAVETAAGDEDRGPGGAGQPAGRGDLGRLVGDGPAGQQLRLPGGWGWPGTRWESTRRDTP